MAHTYTLNLLHVVFSTKNRMPMIRNLDGLMKNLRGIARNKNMDMLAAGGTNNHVHLLLRLPPVRGLSEAVRDLKANSSRYMGRNRCQVCVAGRLCRHQRQPIAGFPRSGVHRQPGTTSREAEL